MNILQLVLENEANLNAKEKERDQRVGENNRKMTALKSEVESEHKCLEEKQTKIKEKIEKGCSYPCSAVEIRIIFKIAQHETLRLLLYMLPLNLIDTFEPD